MAFIITKEIIEKAKTYMPIEDKISLSKIIAEKCVDIIPQSRKNPISDRANKILSLPLPEGELSALKSMLTMSVLLGFYFNIDIDTQNKDAMTFASYDEYASSHPLNQLDRLKSNAEIRDKVYDLVADFKEFKKMVDIEIYNIRTYRNDPLIRLAATIGLYLTKENLNKLKDGLEQMSAQLQQAQEHAEDKTEE